MSISLFDDNCCQIAKLNVSSFTPEINSLTKLQTEPRHTIVEHLCMFVKFGVRSCNRFGAISI